MQVTMTHHIPVPTRWQYAKAALLCFVLFLVAYLIQQNALLVSCSAVLLVEGWALVAGAWMWAFNYLFIKEPHYTGLRIKAPIPYRSRLALGDTFFLWAIREAIQEGPSVEVAPDLTAPNRIERP